MDACPLQWLSEAGMEEKHIATHQLGTRRSVTELIWKGELNRTEGRLGDIATRRASTNGGTRIDCVQTSDD